jgi:hypothetical protein
MTTAFHKPAKLAGRACVCLLLMLGGLRGALAADGAPVGLPPNWSLTAAGDRLQVRGMTMRLSAGVIAGDVASNTTRLRNYWQEPVHVRTDAAGVWVSKAFGTVFATVQLIPGPGGRGTRVVLSKVDLHESVAQPAMQPWSALPVGSQVLMDTQSWDGGRVARHIGFSNGLSAVGNRDHFVRWLTGQGYVLRSDVETPPQTVEGRLLMFSRAEDEVTVVIQHVRGLSKVTVNESRGAPAMKEMP